MPQLDIAGVLKFEVTVDELVKASKQILAETKQAKVRAALARMMAELKKANKKLVKDVLAPLCTISNKRQFDREFDKLHLRFKEYNLGEAPVLSRISCSIVINQLEALKKSQQWKKYIGFSRAVTRLEIIAGEWIANDGALYAADYNMFRDINAFLDDIAGMQDRGAAYRKFKRGIAGIEDRLIAIRDQLSQLEISSAKV